MIEKKFIDVTKKELAKKETITWHKGDCQITTLYSIAASWDYLYIVKGYLNQNIMEIAAICGTEAEMVETLLNFNIQKIQFCSCQSQDESFSDKTLIILSVNQLKSGSRFYLKFN